jgi:putative salt-induced outer membrane protein YdiY
VSNVLVLEGRVLPGHRQAMEAFLRDARPYYESIGDVAMRFLWHTDDDHRFREEFTYHTDEASRQDDERVRSDPEMQVYLHRWRALLDGDITMSVWHEAEL